MSRNKPAEPIWVAFIAVPGGANRLHLDEREAAKFNSDPDGYAAKEVDLSKVEYLQWIDTDGAALCGHRTKGGDLCRNLVSRIQLSAKEWKAKHRTGLCATHARPKPK